MRRDFLTRIRRLTVEGRRAGEGYWSPDGKRLVFQSEREPGNPFYQIYALDLATGDTKRISPGYGKTTCSFFRPGTDEIQFASTHHDPTSKQQQQDELDFRASGKERRYSWDYDPEFEIYVCRPVAKHRAADVHAADQRARLRRRRQLLARRPVDRLHVDARRVQPDTVAPRSRSSSRSIRATSPRFTSCAPDGSGQKRLTNVAGYDGGPFFSPDGKRIIWRRFDDDRTHRECLHDESRRHRPAADHRLRLDELGAVHPPVRSIHPLRLEQARIRELRGVHGRYRRARKSRCALRMPMASTGCPCRRRTAASSRGPRRAPAAAKDRSSWRSGITRKRSKRCAQRLRAVRNE